MRFFCRLRALPGVENHLELVLVPTPLRMRVSMVSPVLFILEKFRVWDYRMWGGAGRLGFEIVRVVTVRVYVGGDVGWPVCEG